MTVRMLRYPCGCYAPADGRLVGDTRVEKCDGGTSCVYRPKLSKQAAAPLTSAEKPRRLSR